MDVAGQHAVNSAGRNISIIGQDTIRFNCSVHARLQGLAGGNGMQCKIISSESESHMDDELPKRSGEDGRVLR